MNNQIIRFFIVVIVGVGFMSVAHSEAVEQHQHSIQVSGVGRVSVKPDRADINLAVEVQAKTAKSAREQASVSMKAVIDAVKSMEVKEKDIQTSYVSLQPEYDPQTGTKIIRYRLSNQLMVHVRDVNKAGAVIDAAVQAGGDATRVQGLNFAVDNVTEAEVKAREKAYENALAKAQQYAKLAGVALGRAITITEGNAGGAVPMAYTSDVYMMKSSAPIHDTPVSVGEQDISVYVNVIFGVD